MTAPPPHHRATWGTLGLAWRLARRDFRHGLAGFRIFLACLALGVAAIATVLSLSQAVHQGLLADGRALLGGDVALRFVHQPPTASLRADLVALGTTAQSLTAELRAMVLSEDRGESTLVELKGVDNAYPLHGTLALEQADMSLATALRPEAADGNSAGNGPLVWGAAVEPAVLERLGLPVAPGVRLRLGESMVIVRAIIRHEPDRIGANPLSLGPRVLITTAALAETGLLQPGGVVYWELRLDLAPGSDPALWRTALENRYPDAPWQWRDVATAAPQVTRFVDRMTVYLSFVGLTVLLIGGLGVGNAVTAHLDRRLISFAVLKAVGAPQRLVFYSGALHVGVLAVLGIAAGLVIGASAPLLIAAALTDVLPVAAQVRLYPGALTLAGLFGVLATITFCLPPLGRAAAVAPTSLFRLAVDPVPPHTPQRFRIATLAAAGLLALVVVLSSPQRGFALAFVLGTLLCVLVFRLAGRLLRALAAHSAPRQQAPLLRLALANLHRPGNASGPVLLSLGLGLTVLVAVSAVEGNFRHQVQERLPRAAPSFYFIDIQSEQLAPLRALVRATPHTDAFEAVPTLRGRITHVNGRDATAALANPNYGWVLRGDRGLTYAATPPVHGQILAGSWWPPDYSGPPRVAIHVDVARAFAIGVGDTLTVNVLGRAITATVAVIRDVDFSSLNIGFALTFAPGLLEAAPQTWIATVRLPEAHETALQKAVVAAFPNIATLRLRTVLATVDRMLAGIGLAARIAGLVTLVAGMLVMAGVLAAGHRRRVYEAVVLKVLGASRRDLLRIYLLEYGALAGVAAILAAGLGTLVAWSVQHWGMHWPWSFVPGALAVPLLLALSVTLLFGFAGTWLVLGQPAAPWLRNE